MQAHRHLHSDEGHGSNLLVRAATLQDCGLQWFRWDISDKLVVTVSMGSIISRILRSTMTLQYQAQSSISLQHCWNVSGASPGTVEHAYVSFGNNVLYSEGENLMAQSLRRSTVLSRVLQWYLNVWNVGTTTLPLAPLPPI